MSRIAVSSAAWANLASVSGLFSSKLASLTVGIREARLWAHALGVVSSPPRLGPERRASHVFAPGRELVDAPLSEAAP